MSLLRQQLVPRVLRNPPGRVSERNYQDQIKTTDLSRVEDPLDLAQSSILAGLVQVGLVAAFQSLLNQYLDVAEL